MFDSNYYPQTNKCLILHLILLKMYVIIHCCEYISGAHKKCRAVITQLKVKPLGLFIQHVHLRSKITTLMELKAI